MPIVNFDQYQAESLAHLAEHFDNDSHLLDVEDFYKYDDVGHEVVMKTIDRFVRLDLVERLTVATIKIHPQVLSVVAQLRGEIDPRESERQSINYHIHGSNSRVNVNSTDNSTNTIIFDYSVFHQVHELVANQVTDPVERDELLKLIAELKSCVGKPTYKEKYKEFIAVAANHASILGPFLPAITSFLG